MTEPGDERLDGPGRDHPRDHAPRGSAAADGGRPGQGHPPAPSPADGDGGQPSPAAGSLTRRQFAAGTGAALFLPLAARLTPWRGGGRRRPGAPVDGDGVRDVRPARRPGAPPAQRGTARQQEEEPPGTGALVDHVRARWGERLSEDDLEQIRSSVAGQLSAGSSIAEVPLANGDGPATVFRAYRGDGG